MSTIAPEQVNIGTGWRHEGAHAQVEGKISGLTEMELEIIGAWAAAALAAFLFVDVCRMYAYVSCRRMSRRTG